jgi:O-antigen ligase
MDRLISPGGGPVIFGYSIALVYSVLFYIRKKISVKKYVILAIILIIGAFFTKSRGAMWSVTILTFISIIANKNSRTNILIFSAALVLVPILYLMIQDFVPRFFLFEDSSRTNTLINSFKIFSKYDLVEILTGKGLGQLFQYNQYIENRTLGWTLNLFNYQGYELLVQPHNTWLYILMEQGFAGLVLMTFVIFVIPFFLNKNTDRRIEMFVFLGTFLFLNIFDSILMIDPGSSAMWWFILIMVVTNLEVKTDVFKSSFFEDKNHDLKGLCDVSVIVEPK